MYMVQLQYALGIKSIDFDSGIRLYDLYILLGGGGGLTIPLFNVFMGRVLLEYAYFLCFICFQWITYVQIVNETKQYSELETHETLKRVTSANAILKQYKSSSLIYVKRHAVVLSFFKS